MKIAHVGSPGFLLASLADAECRSGLDSHALGVVEEPFIAPSRSPLLAYQNELLALSPQVLVVHGVIGVDGLGDPGLGLRALSEIRARGTRAVLWTQPGDFESSDDRAAYENFDAVVSPFMSDCRSTPPRVAPDTTICTAIPFSIPAGVFTFGSAREYGKIPTEPIRVLHIPYRVPGSTVESLHIALSDSRNVRLQIQPPESFRNLEELVQHIQESDLVVEGLDRDTYGVVGALAAAAARPLLSGNSDTWRAAWPAMAHCPVLHATSAGLKDRIHSLAIEPRTLRDFGKRNRAFAETHHHASHVARLTAALYQQLRA